MRRARYFALRDGSDGAKVTGKPPLPGDYVMVHRGQRRYLARVVEVVFSGELRSDPLVTTSIFRYFREKEGGCSG